MKIYNYNVNIFTNNDDISYYLLGAFMTDGCIHLRNSVPIRATLISKDFEWIEKIKNIVCPELPYINHNGSYGFAIHSKQICNWFIDKGCTSNKSLTLIFPNVPEQYLPDFIRGCIDGDGSLGTYRYKKIWNQKSYNCVRRQIYLCSASKLFIQTFNEYLNANNYKFSYVERYPKDAKLTNGRVIHSTSIQYRTTISSNIEINRFLKTIYYAGHQISMKRKYDLATEIIRGSEEYLERDTSFSEERKDNIRQALLKNKGQYFL